MSAADHPSSDPGAPAPTASVWEDFIDIFYAPSAVFERRRGWSALPVLLVLTLVLAFLFFSWQRALGPVLDLEMQRAAQAMGRAGDAGPEQVQLRGSTGRIFGFIGFAFAFPIGVALTALVAWGLARAFGAKAGFTAMLMVVTYSQIVRVPQYVAEVLQAVVLDVARLDSVHDVSLSLARFLDQSQASTLAVNLADRVDLFTLWATALIAIGLSVVTGLSRGRAWGVALLVFLLATVPALIGGLLGG